MMNAVGGHLLRVIGKTAGMPGTLLPSDLTRAIQALEVAVLAEQSQLRKVSDWTDFKGYAGSDTVAIRKSALPLIAMLRRAYFANQAVVWGV